jgi:hypothetical protein
MAIGRSSVGFMLAGVYVIVAVAIIQWEIRHTGGGWINLRDFGTSVVTSPSQLVFAPLLKALGVRRISVDRPGASDVAQLAFHVLVTAVLVYALGWGIHAVVRRILS